MVASLCREKSQLEGQRYLFVCSTPYQIFNVICLRMINFDSIECDLIVMDYFTDASRLVDILSQTHLFGKVVLGWGKEVYDQYYNAPRPIRALFRVGLLLCSGFSLRRFQIDVRNYSRVLVSYNEPLVFLMARKARGRSFEVDFFEDGTAAYCSSGNLIPIGRIERLLGVSRAIFSGVNYVHEPALCERGVDAVKIGNGLASPQCRQVLEKLFLVDDSKRIGTRYIYFDGFDDIDFVSSVVEAIRQETGEEVTVKPHPRRQMKEYGALSHCHIGPSDSIESLVLSGLLGKAPVFVSSCSTAAFVPRLLFDMDIDILFLYKMDPRAERMNGNMLGLISRFSELSGGKKKILTPGSLDELRVDLRKISSDE